MTVDGTGVATTPAAWYPDPQGPPLLRWWDGTAWTQHTRDPRPIPVAQPYVPMQSMARDDAVEQPTAGGSVRNPWIWLLVAMPVVQVALAALVLLVLTDVPGGVIRYAVLVGPIVAHIYLARKDGAALRENGLRSTGWGWILVPLVYFILRATRIGKGGVPPLLAWVALQLVVSGVALAVAIPIVLAQQEQARQIAAGGTGDARPLSEVERAYQLTPTGMNERLLRDMQAGDFAVTSVNCAQATSIRPGTEVLCATDLDGGYTVFVVTIIDDDPYTPFYLTGMVD